MAVNGNAYQGQFVINYKVKWQLFNLMSWINNNLSRSTWAKSVYDFFYRSGRVNITKTLQINCISAARTSISKRIAYRNVLSIRTWAQKSDMALRSSSPILFTASVPCSLFCEGTCKIFSYTTQNFYSSIRAPRH